MITLVRLLTSGWFWSFIAVLLLGLGIWFVGPLIEVAGVALLGGAGVRIAAALILLLVWLVLFLIFRPKREDALPAATAAADPVAEAEASAEARAIAEEAAALEQKFKDVAQIMAKAPRAIGGGSFYQLPWYLVLGPPGAGKTTALARSGLVFPMAEHLAPEAGMPTASCDFWITNEAVLVDTAGRLTTQDSDKAVDAATWGALLDQLKRHRARQPVNGVLVMLSLADLALVDEQQRQATGRAIRQRLVELRERLGVRFPVYLVLAKADQVAGFGEFFAGLEPGERAQVWGMTLPLDARDLRSGRDGPAEPGQLFEAEFQQLLSRLDDRLIEHLQAEGDLGRRALVFGFPGQIASFAEPIRALVDDVFRPSRFEPRQFLRGIYLTSAGADGGVIDLQAGGLPASLGLSSAPVASALAVPERGRGWFLYTLLRGVIFAEANMVGVDQMVERQRRNRQRLALAGALGVGLLLGGAVAFAAGANQRLLAAVAEGIAQYRQALAGISTSEVTDGDPARVVPALEALAAMPVGVNRAQDDPPILMTLGLYQGRTTGAAALGAYRRALDGLFLPRLMLRLEDQLRLNSGRVEVMVPALKVYLQLAGEGPLEPALVRQWLTADWEAAYPGPENAALRATLLRHLEAALADPRPRLPVDPALVQQVRSLIAARPLGDRVYALAKEDPRVAGKPAWRVQDAAGPAAPRALRRRSGAGLNEGVPWIFTAEGFREAMLPAIDDAAVAISEDWLVYGAASKEALQPSRLIAEAQQLYLDEYGREWDSLLADIQVQPLGNLRSAVDILGVLSGPASPMRALLQAVAREVQPAAQAKAAAAAKEAELKAQGQQLTQALPGAAAAVQQAQRAQRLAGLAAGALNRGPPPGQAIDDRFKPLVEFVQGPGAGAPSPLDDAIKTIAAVFDQLNRVALAPDPGGAQLAAAGNAEFQSAMRQLQALSRRLPDPIDAWLEVVVTDSGRIAAGQARQSVSEAFKNDVASFCQQAIGGRFPFEREANSDVTLADFGRLFAPGGIFDAFFDKNLKAFVNTTTTPWSWQAAGGVDLGYGPETLAMFERAARIRDAYFSGGQQPAMTFTLKPVELDARASQVVLTLGQQSMTYAHGPPRAATWRWPPPGDSTARLSFTAGATGRFAAVSRDGPWSWFRLLDLAEINRTPQADRFSVNFRAGEFAFNVDLQAASVKNPFASDPIRGFRCPAGL
ncbi:MAG: type VI secretion system membrane subunit TssM [Thalassobaculales bacterium]